MSDETRPDSSTDSGMNVVTKEYKADIKDIKAKLIIERAEERTIIVVIAINQDSKENLINRVHCRKGIPISGYAYDVVSDTYHVLCQDFLLLGCIPLSFCQTMPGIGNWRRYVPMPESVIRRHLDNQQRSDLRNFKYTHKNCTYDFLQIIESV